MKESSKGSNEATADEATADRRRENRLNIPLTDEEKREVRIRAAREDKPMTKYVREILFSDSEAVPA